MKVTAGIRKLFERAYADNKYVRACEWCALTHCYQFKPSLSIHKTPTDAQPHVNALLRKFVEMRARDNHDALANFTTETHAQTYSAFVAIMSEEYDAELAGKPGKDIA